ncbi:MAG: FAD-dependent oxidoreductase [Phycisphaerales bacterium]
MSVRECDVVVVGAGPAGLAAAATCAARGASVLVLDEGSGTGGQIWRGRPSGEHAKWRAIAAGAGAEVELGASVFGVEAGPRHRLSVAVGRRGLVISAQRVILATGARELLLPFEGWTIPGVLGAGGLQAMIKQGLRVKGERVVVGGSGPLLAAVAALVRQSGAEVAAVVEQAPRAALMGVARALAAAPSKALQAAELAVELRGVPKRLGWWPRRAIARDGRLAALEITNGVRREVIGCTLAGIGFGLVPNTRLAGMLGCAVTAGGVRVDRVQRTTVPGVWCAGEAVGVGGVDAAVAEGEIAGADAAGAVASDEVFRRRDRARRFVDRMSRAFALRDELRAMPGERDCLCRCEDVAMGEVAKWAGWREAKLQTRCGMGVCQGRTCGPAAAFLFGWPVDDSRPPLLPVALGAMLDTLPAPGAAGHEKGHQ